MKESSTWVAPSMQGAVMHQHARSVAATEKRRSGRVCTIHVLIIWSVHYRLLWFIFPCWFTRRLAYTSRSVRLDFLSNQSTSILTSNDQSVLYCTYWCRDANLMWHRSLKINPVHILPADAKMMQSIIGHPGRWWRHSANSSRLATFPVKIVACRTSAASIAPRHPGRWNRAVDIWWVSPNCDDGWKFRLRRCTNGWQNS